MNTLQEHPPEQPNTKTGAPPAKHNYLAFRLLAGVDFLISVFFGVITTHIIILSKDYWMAGGYAIVILAIFWMVLHTFLAFMLIITAKPFSITKRLAVVNIILNIILIAVFWGIFWVEMLTRWNNVNIMLNVLFITMVSWLSLSILAPLILFILSFIDRK